MPTPYFKHYFVEIMHENGQDAKKINEAIQEEEKGGNEFVSVQQTPRTENWLLCFRYLDGTHDDKG